MSRLSTIFLASLACCGCGTNHDAADGGDGAAEIESGVDGDTDGSAEAGVDSRVSDGARDGATDGPYDADGGSEPAGWVPLPGLPEGCVVERAEHPEVLFHAAWTSCGEGCERLVPEPEFQRAFASSVRHHDALVGYLGIVQRDRFDLLARRMVLLATTEGTVLGAWRGPDPLDPGVCAAGLVTVGDGMAAFLVTIAGNGWPTTERLYHAPISEIGQVTEPVAVLDETVLVGSNGLQNLAVSSTTVAAELQPRGSVWVFEGGETRELAGPGSTVTGNPQRVQVVGRDVFWLDYGTRKRLAHGRIDQEESIYFEVTDADVLHPSVTSDRLVWQQGYDFVGGAVGWTRGELWTAPFPSEPSAIEPRMVVAEFRAGAVSTAGPHVYAVLLEEGVYVYALEDGQRRLFSDRDGWVIVQRPLYLSDTEMLLYVGKDGVGTVMRVQIDSIPYVE